ncbi:unnamed protein product, partial [Discosporangium mesarthrocarpum]
MDTQKLHTNRLRGKEEMRQFEDEEQPRAIDATHGVLNQQKKWTESMRWREFKESSSSSPVHAPSSGGRQKHPGSVDLVNSEAGPGGGGRGRGRGPRTFFPALPRATLAALGSSQGEIGSEHWYWEDGEWKGYGAGPGPGQG